MSREDYEAITLEQWRKEFNDKEAPAAGAFPRRAQRLQQRGLGGRVRTKDKA